MKNKLFVCVSILAGVFILGLGTTRANASPGTPKAAGVAWQRLLHRSLAMYWQKQHKDVFELIEKSVRLGQPSPGVHQVLGLMRKAYLECRSPRQPKKAWNTFVLAYVKKLSSKPKLTDTDLVLLSLTKQGNTGTVDEASLDKLMAKYPDSPWIDWAFWTKARVIGLRAHAGHHPFGVIALRGNKPHVGCLVMYKPQVWIQGRAAKSFLRQHRDSYMGEVMRVDLTIWHMTQAVQALAVLEKNVWYTKQEVGAAFPLSKKQIEAIANAKASLKSVGSMWPETTQRRLTANTIMRDFLFDQDDNWRIVDYFNEITKMPKGEGYMLQKDITDWITPLLEKRREQKAQWHTWKPTSAPTTRPAIKLRRDANKP